MIRSDPMSPAHRCTSDGGIEAAPVQHGRSARTTFGVSVDPLEQIPCVWGEIMSGRSGTGRSAVAAIQFRSSELR